MKKEKQEIVATLYSKDFSWLDNQSISEFIAGLQLLVQKWEYADCKDIKFSTETCCGCEHCDYNQEHNLAIVGTRLETEEEFQTRIEREIASEKYEEQWKKEEEERELKIYHKWKKKLERKNKKNQKQ